MGHFVPLSLRVGKNLGPNRVNPYLDWWGGGKIPPRVFAKYLKNGLTDLHETL